MRPFWLGFAFLLGLLTLPALALGDDDPPTDAGQEKAKELFISLDTNQDGSVTADEVPEDKRGLFRRLVRLGDRDKDEKLTLEEFLAAMGRPETSGGGEGEQSTDRSPRQRFRALRDRFQQLDANGDGKLSLDELPGERREVLERIIERLDRDGDKALSPAELAEAARRAPDDSQPGNGQPGDGPPPTRGDGLDGGPPFGLLFRLFDKNYDGAISADEIAAAAESLKKLDRDRDGSITLDELRDAGRPDAGDGGRRPDGPGSGLDRLMSFDKNGDGKLSKDELPERLQRRFGRMDANRDGLLDRGEIRRALMDFMRRRGPGAPPAGLPGQPPTGGGPPPGATEPGATVSSAQGPSAPEAAAQAPETPEQARTAERLKGGQLARRLEKADANGDGKLSKDELPARLQKVFDRLDSNHDSAIDKAEIASYVAARAKKQMSKNKAKNGPKSEPSSAACS